jgi:DNA-binding beta-propeller fold protein YncE
MRPTAPRPRRYGRRTAAPAVLAFAAGAAVALAGGCPVDPQRLEDVVFAVAPGAVWTDGAPRVAPAQAGEVRAILTNALDDTVSVVALAPLLDDDPANDAAAELARFPVGLAPLEREGPHHVAVAPGGRVAFVGLSNFVPGGGSGPHGVHGSGTAEGRALRIDLDTLRTTAATRVDRNPGDVRLTPDGSRLLLTHFDLVAVADAARDGVLTGPALDARLAVLDPVTMTRQALVPLCPAAHGMAISRDGRTLVSSCTSDEAAVVDLDRAAAGDAAAVTRVTLLDVPGNAASPVCAPYAVTLTPDDATAWVSCYRSGELVGVDVARRARSGGLVVLPGLAVFGSFAGDGATLALAVQETDGIAFIVDDGAGGAQLTRFLPLPPDRCTLPHTTAWVDDDRALLVVCEGNKRDPGTLIVLDVETGRVRAGVAVGRFPDDVALAVPPVVADPGAP